MQRYSGTPSGELADVPGGPWYCIADAKTNAVVGFVAERYLPWVLFNLNDGDVQAQEILDKTPFKEISLNDIPDYTAKKGFVGAKLVGTGKG